MLILACDTSGPAVSAAIWQDGRLLAEKMLQSGQPHSTTLMPLIEELLRDSNLQAGAMDAFACSVGPGSFTGIRIGVSSVQAMAFAAGRPAIGVSALEAMAWPYSACPGLLVCPMLDARNQRIYASAWLAGKAVISEANWLASEFLSLVASLPGNAAPDFQTGVLVTSFWPDSLNRLPAELLHRFQRAPASASLPRSAAIAEIAEMRLKGGADGSPQNLQPRYLGTTQAERSRQGRSQADHPWKIRPAQLADLPGLTLLEQTCFTIPWSQASLRHDLTANPDARCLVAEAPDGFLAGYGAFWAVLDEGQITNLAVHPAWRRRGIGRSLLDALIRQAAAEGLSSLVLEVRSGNSAARQLYEEAGFLPRGLRKGYYADNGEDAIIMFKKFG